MTRWKKRQRKFEYRWAQITVSLMVVSGFGTVAFHFWVVPFRHLSFAIVITAVAVALESAILLTVRNGYVLQLNPRERFRKKYGESLVAVELAHSTGIVTNLLDGCITKDNRVVRASSVSEGRAIETVILDLHTAESGEFPAASRYLILGPPDVDAQFLRRFRWKTAARDAREPEILVAKDANEIHTVLALDSLRHSYALELVGRHATAVTFVLTGGTLALVVGYLLWFEAGAV